MVGYLVWCFKDDGNDERFRRGGNGPMDGVIVSDDVDDEFNFFESVMLIGDGKEKEIWGVCVVVGKDGPQVLID
ncbi:hypothetical protein QVD17_24807 [Tagetes erecta]|uniref:Uncharacterized protein n=1 Tax=Tagetes erecta TaxID=13708 RepID=A0AAD8KIZ6_TARER|nr:hypothetical protein QVD17_24807 [Tagetes erecta]